MRWSKATKVLLDRLIWLQMTVLFGVLCSDLIRANQLNMDVGQGIELLSSVMWKKEQRYIYPPGVPAVLLQQDENRVFVIEQYYSQAVDPKVLKVYVRGPWYQGKWVHASDSWRNQYLVIQKPRCRREVTTNDKGVKLGFRCQTEVKVDAALPSGGLGLSIAYQDLHGDVIHPNGVFWFVIPESSKSARQQLEKSMISSIDKLAESSFDPMESGAYESLREAIESYVIRITGRGRVVLGSGYITRDPEPFFHLFPGVRQELRNRDLPCGGVFAVTASHLFPSGFSSDGHAEELGGNFQDIRVFKNQDLFDIQLHQRPLSEQSAVLVGKNEEVDLALLYLNEKGVSYVGHRAEPNQQEQFGLPCEDITGLPLAQSVGLSQNLSILGFSGRGEDRLLVKSGFLHESGTDDTSNIGPVSKLKIFKSMGESGVFAEDGMSGGPVLNLDGEVVGLSVERPLANNSLIALDLTSLRQVKGFDYFQQYSTSSDCILKFNPFDRVLNLVNLNPVDCEYGNFGSREALLPLSGAWMFQEVMSLVELEDLREFGSGYVGRNGHSIISGQMLIDGLPVLRGETVVISGSDDIDRANRHRLLNGFQFDALSWRPMVSVGVRILHSPFMDSNKALDVSGVINKVKIPGGGSDYQSVYSARKFASWLRDQELSEDVLSSVCYLGETCGR